VKQRGTQRHSGIIDQREMLRNQHRKELARTKGNTLVKTTNQGVARSSRAGCTKGINKLRAVVSGCPFCLCRTAPKLYSAGTIDFPAWGVALVFWLSLCLLPSGVRVPYCTVTLSPSIRTSTRDAVQTKRGNEREPVPTHHDCKQLKNPLNLSPDTQRTHNHF
jgi:hypothetical protein